MTRTSILIKFFSWHDNVMLNVFTALRRYVRYRRDYRYLRSLPEYVLQDLGLSRDQIDEADSANRLWR